MPKVPYKVPGRTPGVWGTPLRIGTHEELMEESEKHMRACSIRIDTSDRCEEEDGKMWRFATIKTFPNRRRSFNILQLNGDHTQEIDLTEFARKAVSLGKSAVGRGTIEISASRRLPPSLPEGQAEASDLVTHSREGTGELYRVKVRLTSFTVEGWSDEGKHVKGRFDNPPVDLPSNFGYLEDGYRRRDVEPSMHEVGDSSDDSDDSQTTAAKVKEALK